MPSSGSSATAASRLPEPSRTKLWSYPWVMTSCGNACPPLSGVGLRMSRPIGFSLVKSNAVPATGANPVGIRFVSTGWYLPGVDPQQLVEDRSARLTAQVEVGVVGEVDHGGVAAGRRRVDHVVVDPQRVVPGQRVGHGGRHRRREARAARARRDRAALARREVVRQDERLPAVARRSRWPTTRRCSTRGTRRAACWCRCSSPACRCVPLFEHPVHDIVNAWLAIRFA